MLSRCVDTNELFQTTSGSIVIFLTPPLEHPKKNAFSILPKSSRTTLRFIRTELYVLARPGHLELAARTKAKSECRPLSVTFG
mmetsp:Transcript_52930/g.106093  ORF Transcript_52930/g.106093 Transcript_52930/m.106093 type:complete len:83 (-) Transcript_52930:1075-1323(-)